MVNLRTFIIVFTIFLVSNLALASRLSAEKSTKQAISDNIYFQQRNHQIILKAHHATWLELLSKLEQSSGVRFHYDSLPQNTFNISMQRVTFQEALAQLFGSAASYACSFPKATTKSSTAWPKDVWIVWAIADNSTIKSPLLNNEINSSENYFAEEKNDKTNQNSQAEKLNALLDKAKNGKPDERDLALVELSLMEDDANKNEINTLLKKGLKNKSPDVRSQVLFGLANRGGEDVQEILWNGIHDEVVGVRISALSALNYSEENISILREATLDLDETVRQLAVDKLKAAGIETENY